MQYPICIRFEHGRNSINLEEHIEAVQRMQEYIEENLTSEITMADLAGVSMYSPWYSYRLFVQVTEKPARKVIIKRGKEAKDYWNYLPANK